MSGVPPEGGRPGGLPLWRKGSRSVGATYSYIRNRWGTQASNLMSLHTQFKSTSVRKAEGLFCMFMYLICACRSVAAEGWC